MPNQYRKEKDTPFWRSGQFAPFFAEAVDKVGGIDYIYLNLKILNLKTSESGSGGVNDERIQGDNK
ncbi:hypothetical protein [Paenibacillus monticola]|uniref:hypothetical protein n=1 Tax=Paenibacillus monticola TaxID=2666075 RepID=UPI001E3F4FDB|nr:hypothetical protein [Paenibacillus monticola]